MYWFGGALAIGLLSSLAYISITYEKNPEKKCLEAKKAVEIGGCDQYGSCGVKFDDGTFGREYYPAPGQYFCTKRQGKD